MSENLNQDFDRLARLSRAELRRLARKKKLMRQCFKVFREACYPDAPDHQIRELKISFMAGAAELLSMILAAMDPESPHDVDEADLDLMSGISAELTAFHSKTLQRVLSEAAMVEKRQRGLDG